jgi:hypothetical protein
VFEAVVAPAARSVDIELTFEEAREAALDGRELTDDELELVADGAGMLYRKLVSGVLAATLVFGASGRAQVSEMPFLSARDVLFAFAYNSRNVSRRKDCYGQ